MTKMYHIAVRKKLLTKIFILFHNIYIKYHVFLLAYRNYVYTEKLFSVSTF